MEKKYITIKEASKLLGVSPLTLRNWDKSGKLPASRYPFNNYRVYKVEDIEKVLKQIESGEKPAKKDTEKKVIHRNEKKFYKVNVIHLKD